MSPIQILILIVWGLVTFANTFVIQPDINWSPLYHGLVISADVTLFWLGLVLKSFVEMGQKADIPAPGPPVEAPAAPLVKQVAALEEPLHPAQ